LDGIYEKAEKVVSISPIDNNLRLNECNNKQTQKQQVSSSKYVKYAGMAAGFLLLISSALYINNYIEKNNQIDSQPIPSNMRMIGYTDHLIEKATDIIAVKASQENNDIALKIIKSYKSSGIDPETINYLSNDVVGLSLDQSAIVFIDAGSKDTPVMDIFVWEPDSNSFVNPYGEIITEEILNNSN
jgi:hypothetical protein